MPRTKQPKRNVKQEQDDEKNSAFKAFEESFNRELDEFNKKMDEMIKECEEKFDSMVEEIPQKYLDLKYCDLLNMEEKDDITTTTISQITAWNFDMSKFNKTGQSKTSSKRQQQHSTTDEGYRTADGSSGDSASGPKSKSRSVDRSGGDASAATAARQKHNKPATVRPRRSRSLNRTTRVMDMKTPSESRALPNSSPSYGFITPKVKPNAPQVILRRPKNGELAFSMQGTPLLTAGAVAETVANLNIPLPNGNMVTIQPMRGLRESQIPDIDPEVKKQLEKLRDNLNLVCKKH